MQINNIAIAFRNIWRNRVFSAINLAGLTIGMAVFFLIFEYVAFEYGANRFHKHFDRLYRLSITTKGTDVSDENPPGIGPIMMNKFPGIKRVVRVAEGIDGGVVSVVNNDNTFREEDISYADDGFFSSFSFPLLAGSPSLAAPGTVAMSASMANKLFGKTQVTGNTISITNQFGSLPYTVGAVFSDLPPNSDVKANILISFSTLNNKANRNGNDWADPQTLQSGFAQMYVELNQNIPPQQIEQAATTYFRSFDPEAKDKQIVLQPFSALHLAPAFNYPLHTFGSLPLVLMLLTISILILVIAWVNYINLSAAQAINRTKEVGIRKVLGASRAQLIRQYLTETFIVTIIAVVLAGLIAMIAQPVFNVVTGKPLSLVLLLNPLFFAVGLSLIVVGSLGSGIYVAVITSAYNPTQAIREKIMATDRGWSLRKALLVFQFAISVTFIIATIVLYQQLRYMQNSDLGMNIKQKLVVKGPTGFTKGSREQSAAFKNALVQLPFVEKMAASNNIPGQGYNFSADGIQRPNGQKGDDKKSYGMLIVDDHYFDTYGITLKEGKNFSTGDVEKSWGKSHRVILNERAARELGFADDAPVAGSQIIWGEPYEVVGVVKDYHHLGLHQAISPVIFLPSTAQGYFTIVTPVAGIASKIADIRKLYRGFFPGSPFEYFFADEQYDLQYRQDQQLGNVFIGASSIAILIACLGLFGLTAFTAKQRVREIGIRKVLGAGVQDILQLLSKDFLGLIVIAILIAVPLAWWGMHKWLQEFVYRIQISWWVFAAAGGMVTLVAVLTVSVHAIRAALANPVKSLRSE